MRTAAHSRSCPPAAYAHQQSAEEYPSSVPGAARQITAKFNPPKFGGIHAAGNRKKATTRSIAAIAAPRTAKTGSTWTRRSAEGAPCRSCVCPPKRGSRRHPPCHPHGAQLDTGRMARMNEASSQALELTRRAVAGAMARALLHASMHVRCCRHATKRAPSAGRQCPKPGQDQERCLHTRGWR